MLGDSGILGRKGSPQPGQGWGSGEGPQVPQSCLTPRELVLPAQSRLAQAGPARHSTEGDIAPGTVGPCGPAGEPAERNGENLHFLPAPRGCGHDGPDTRAH